MSAAAKKDDDAVTLATLARDALAARDGNIEKAIGYLVNRLKRDENLLQILVEGAIRDAIGMRVNSAHLNNRAAVIRAASRADVEALAIGHLYAFMDFPLGDGTKLRNATREQVESQAERYAKISSDTGHKHRWLRLIAQSTPPDQLVGESLTEARISALWKETANA